MPSSNPTSERTEEQDEFLRQFGDRVRFLRHLNKLSQERLALSSGLHRTEVGKLERGERNVGILAVKALAEALKVDVGELFRPNPTSV